MDYTLNDLYIFLAENGFPKDCRWAYINGHNDNALGKPRCASANAETIVSE